MTPLANGYGNTALHEACINGSVSTIEHLLVSGAKVNAENHKGSTPLHLYCYGERKSDHTLDGLRVLLENGANIEAADHRGTTPLLVCCASGRFAFCV
jgi:ankyrin repeat protein